MPILLIWGSKYQSKILGNAGIECTKCYQMPCQLYLLEKKLTLYFVPTITTHARYALGCPSCHYRWLIEDVVGDRFYRNILANNPLLPPAEKRIMFIGPSNVGKSSTANALLMLSDPNRRGNALFPIGNESGTTTQIEETSWLGDYKLLDTPGLMDKSLAYMPSIMSTAKRCELIVYTSTGQLHLSEIEFLARLHESQSQWDSYSNTPMARKLILYVNRDASKEHTMSTQDKGREKEMIQDQVKDWIPEDRIAFGVSLNFSQTYPPQIDDLEQVLLEAVEI